MSCSPNAGLLASSMLRGTKCKRHISGLLNSPSRPHWTLYNRYLVFSNDNLRYILYTSFVDLVKKHKKHNIWLHYPLSLLRLTLVYLWWLKTQAYLLMAWLRLVDSAWINDGFLSSMLRRIRQRKEPFFTWLTENLPLPTSAIFVWLRDAVKRFVLTDFFR